MEGTAPAPVNPQPDLVSMWMNLVLALLPLATSGPWAAIAGPLMALVMAEIQQAKAALAQSAELTPEQVTAFDAWLADLMASDAWKVRP